MFNNFPFLSLTIWLPILGGLWVVFRGSRSDSVKAEALIFSIVTFILSLVLLYNFDSSTAEMQFLERVSWIPVFGIEYSLGLDGISLPLVLLTTFITILVILAAGKSIGDRLGFYLGAFLILEGVMVGVFAALDAVLFYVFWEAMLIPMFLIIGIWPLAMGVTMWMQQKLNPAPPDPMQARIMMLLPIVFTFICARFASGLVIYWTWNNILSIIQQWVIMRRMGVKA